MKQIDILPGANERLSKDSPHPLLLKSLAFTRDIKTNTKMYEMVLSYKINTFH